MLFASGRLAFLHVNGMDVNKIPAWLTFQSRLRVRDADEYAL